MSDLMDWAGPLETMLPPPPPRRTITEDEGSLILELLDNPNGEDTTPLSGAEIAQKLFESRVMPFALQNKMRAGNFFATPEVKKARADLRAAVGRAIEDKILDELLLNHKHLFI